MTKLEVRLKCLEICNRLDLPPELIIARAKEFEKFLGELLVVESIEKAPLKRGRPSKADTADILG